MNVDPKVQRIMDWRESLAVLKDENFFRIIRMYLGEVKTPYNKQKLIEELGAFVRREENKKNILSLLTYKDLTVLTAINLINDATETKLISFFGSDVNPVVLSDHIVNLKERLLVYSHKRMSDGLEILDINPLLEDVLKPYLVKEVIFCEETMEEVQEPSGFYLTPEYIASFISFVNASPDLCKNDGQFKKGSLNHLKNIFSSSSEEESIKTLYLLNKGLCSLGILHEGDRGISLDQKRFELFAKLEDRIQCAFIATATAGHLSRSALQSACQLLLDTLSELPSRGFTLKKILQLSVLVQNRSTGEIRASSSRFAQMMQRNQSSSASSSALMEAIIDASVLFGILYCTGTNTDGEKVYAVSPSFLADRTSMYAPSGESPKVLSIDAGFSITLLPGLSLKELVPLVSFLSIVRYDTVVTLEITRQSVQRGFDRGLQVEEILDLLKKYSAYDIPQNLKVSIEEWFASYMSATLYKGYVLKVSEENEVIVRNNPVLASRIKAVLAPGVFLLDFKEDEEAEDTVLKSGLNFIGSIKTFASETEVLGLPNVSFRPQYCEESGSLASDLIVMSSATQKKIMDDFIKDVEVLDIDEDIKQGLIERINGRIIVNKSQIRPESVRYEKLEAFGMDYAGKIHVVESAIASECMIEMDMEGVKESIVGRPANLNKKEGNFILMVEPGRVMKSVNISAALRIKKLRNSLYC